MTKTFEPYKYFVYRCRHCGAVAYTRTDQKTTTCRHCYKINKLFDQKMLILLRTNDVQEAVAAVQAAKFKKATFKVKPLHG